jgi:CRP-like cAMP-binding protein
MASAKAIKDSKLIIMLDFSLRELLDKHPKIMNKIKKIIDSRNEKNKKLLY